MISKRTINLFGLGLTIIAIFFIGKLLLERNQGDRIEYITEEEYLTYNKLGMIYDGSESEIFDYLKENLKIDDSELVAEIENYDTYNGFSDNNFKFLKSHLIDCKEVTELLYTKEIKEGEIIHFIIDYTNANEKRIILEYTYTGFVQKTIDGKKYIVAISSDLKKQTYRK